MYLVKKKICHTENKKLHDLNISIQTFGNVSIRLNKELFIIKPSGVNLNKVQPNKYPVVNIKTNKVISGTLKPSVDSEIHRQIYTYDNNIKSIAHSHSLFATSFAQANLQIPVLGTTHADYFPSKILITKKLSKKEVSNNYELNIGKSIIEALKINKVDAKSCRAILINNHGSFSWGYSNEEAVINMEALEYIAKLAYYTLNLKQRPKIEKFLINKHYLRKHGNKSYYGQ